MAQTLPSPKLLPASNSSWSIFSRETHPSAFCCLWAGTQRSISWDSKCLLSCQHLPTNRSEQEYLRLWTLRDADEVQGVWTQEGYKTCQIFPKLPFLSFALATVSKRGEGEGKRLIQHSSALRGGTHDHVNLFLWITGKLKERMRKRQTLLGTVRIHRHSRHWTVFSWTKQASLLYLKLIQAL